MGFSPSSTIEQVFLRWGRLTPMQDGDKSSTRALKWACRAPAFAHPLALLAQGQEETLAGNAVGQMPHGHGPGPMCIAEVHWNIN